jgi:hypothetical protein
MIAVAGIASRSDASLITVPVGLAPGSEYRLVFVTDGTYAAASSDIADYNNEVNTEANSVGALAALGTTWLDIGSTASVTALDNIGPSPGVPLYNLDGELVANTVNYIAGMGAPLFNGGSLYYLNTIDFDENGNLDETYVWTGTLASGVPFIDTGSGNDVCDALGCSPYPTVGYSGCTGACWTQDTGASPDTLYSLYGISGILTVPASTPEPPTAVMLCLSVAVLLFATRARSMICSPLGDG